MLLRWVFINSIINSIITNLLHYEQLIEHSLTCYKVDFWTYTAKLIYFKGQISQDSFIYEDFECAFFTYLYNWALQFHIFVYLLFSQYKSFQSSNDFLKIKTWVFANWSAVGGCACRSGDVFEVNRWNVSGTKPARSLPSLWGKPRQIIRELTATKIEWGRFSLFCVCVCACDAFFSVSFSLYPTQFSSCCHFGFILIWTFSKSYPRMAFGLLIALSSFSVCG